MFAPTKVWRKWHRKINTNQKRYAVCSAISASAVPALVMARGHRIQKVDEVPLVVADDLQFLKRTRNAVTVLQRLKLGQEINRCKRRYMRAGRGKSRNRRWRHRQGPLIVYAEDHGLYHAFRNIRGVDFCRVDQLNLLKLCPGGHVGRLVVWTESAFRKLNRVWGTHRRPSTVKSNYSLPRPIMTNSDLNRIINSQEIQSSIRPKKRRAVFLKKRNPLKHPDLYARFNPLFEKQWTEIKKTYREGARPRTTRVLKPIKKKQRVQRELTADEKKSMQKYWTLVLGEKLFKNRELLAAEREAVRQLKDEAVREKKGLDMLEILKAEKGQAEAQAQAKPAAAKKSKPKEESPEEESD
jgi:large subunit ribosomal protein L4e